MKFIRKNLSWLIAGLFVSGIVLVLFSNTLAVSFTGAGTGNGEYTPKEGLVEVCKKGCLYSTIGDALDSITDASFSNRRTLLIHSANYPENVVGKNFVNIVCDTINACVLTPTSGVAYTAPSILSTVNNINCEMNVAVSGAKCFQSTSGQHIVTNDILSLTSSTPGVTGMLIDSNNSTIIASTNSWLYQMTGSSVGVSTHEPVKITGTGSNTFITTDYNVVLGDVDDNVNMWNEGATGNHRIAVANFVGTMTNPSYSGVFNSMVNSVAGTEKFFTNSAITLVGAGSGTARCYSVDSGGNSSKVNSSNVRCKVTGFANNIFANVGATDELVSTSDPLEVEILSTGAGIVTFEDSQASSKIIQSSAETLVIESVNEWHAVDFLETTSLVQDMTLTSGTSGSFTAISDDGDGQIKLTAAGHSLLAGDYITLTGSAYDDIYTVESIVASTSFNVIATFGLTDTGTFRRGTSAGVLKRGSYKTDLSFSVTPVGNNKDYEFATFRNATMISGSNIISTFTTGGDTKVIPMTTGDTFEVGDVIWWGIRNIGDETDIDINSGTMFNHKIS